MNQDINCAEYTRGGESFCSIVCILGGEIDEGLLNLKIRKQFGVWQMDKIIGMFDPQYSICIFPTDCEWIHCITFCLLF